MYSPTMSRTFATNCGSVDRLNVSCRWGCSPKARQIRPPDRRRRNRHLASHRAPAPVRCSGRHRLQRTGDHGLDLRVTDRARRSRPRRIEQSIEPLLHEASTPLRYRLLSHAQLLRDRLVVLPARALKHDLRAQGQRLRCLASLRRRLQLCSLAIGQHKLGLRPSSHLSPLAIATLYDRSG